VSTLPPPPPTTYWAFNAAPNRPARSRRPLFIVCLLLAAELLAAGVYVFIIRAVPSNASKSTDGAFYLILPPGWQYSAEGFSIGSFKTDFFAGKTTNGTFTDNVSVLQNGGYSLSYVEANFDSLKQQIVQTYGATEFTPKSMVTVNGEPGISWQYHLVMGNHQLEGEQIYTVHKGMDYVVTLTCSQTDFDGVVSGDFQSMLNSWRWQ
jgi:hypothetical protein